MSEDANDLVAAEPVADTKEPIPYERFAASRAEIRALKAELEPLRQRAEQWAAASKETATLREQIAALQAEHADVLALHRAGLGDDEGQAVAQALYGRLPQDARPPTIGEWARALRAEGASIPKALQPYMLSPAAPAAPASVPAPKPAAANGTAPASNGSPSAEAIRLAREKLRTTGDGHDLAALVGWTR